MAQHAIQPEAATDGGAAAALSAEQRDAIEAAAFRKLVAHLRERTDVQNIALMNLAGFCRNCLSRWYGEAAADRGATMGTPEAREVVYGMPYREWQATHQREATPEQKEAFSAAGAGG